MFFLCEQKQKNNLIKQNNPKEYPQQQQPNEKVTACSSQSCLKAG
jgi:hypothetical protein